MAALWLQVLAIFLNTYNQYGQRISYYVIWGALFRNGTDHIPLYSIIPNYTALPIFRWCLKITLDRLFNIVILLLRSDKIIWDRVKLGGCAMNFDTPSYVGILLVQFTLQVPLWLCLVRLSRRYRWWGYRRIPSHLGDCSIRLLLRCRMRLLLCFQHHRKIRGCEL